MTLSSGIWVIPGLILFLLLFCTLFKSLFRLLLRTVLSLGLLRLLTHVPCLTLGVNPVNALILGVLGIPGLGLLLLLRWIL